MYLEAGSAAAVAPRIAMGDRNMEAAELEASGWPTIVDGKVMVPVAAFCVGGIGSAIAHIVVLQGLYKMSRWWSTVNNTVQVLKQAALERCGRHLNLHSRLSHMITVVTDNVARVLTRGLSKLNLPVSAGISKVLLDGLGGCRTDIVRLSQQLGIGNIDSGRNVGADLQLAGESSHERGGLHTTPLDLWFKRCCLLEFRHSGLHVDTAQVCSG